MKISIFTNGWNWSNTRVKPVLIMMMLISSCNVYARDGDVPDMKLLEFLGEGVSVDNEVVDPMSWRDMENMTGSRQDKAQASQQKQKQQESRRQDHE